LYALWALVVPGPSWGLIWCFALFSLIFGMCGSFDWQCEELNLIRFVDKNSIFVEILMKIKPNLVQQNKESSLLKIEKHETKSLKSAPAL